MNDEAEKSRSHLCMLGRHSDDDEGQSSKLPSGHCGNSPTSITLRGNQARNERKDNNNHPLNSLCGCLALFDKPWLKIQGYFHSSSINQAV